MDRQPMGRFPGICVLDTEVISRQVARTAGHHPARAGNRPADRSRPLGRRGRRDIPGVSGLTAVATMVTGRAGHSEVMDWPVLASLPQNERLNLVARLRRQAYRRDEVIFHQGDPADTLHLIAAGHVSVRVTLRGGEFVTVAIFGPGDTFGEFALVADAHRRSATVVALEPSETLVLGRPSSSVSGRPIPALTGSSWNSFPPGSRRSITIGSRRCTSPPKDA